MVPTCWDGALESLLNLVAKAALFAGAVKQDALFVVPFIPGCALTTLPD